MGEGTGFVGRMFGMNVGSMVSSPVSSSPSCWVGYLLPDLSVGERMGSGNRIEGDAVNEGEIGPVGSCAGDCVGEKVGSTIGDCVGEKVGSDVGSCVGENVGASVSFSKSFPV